MSTTGGNKGIVLVTGSAGMLGRTLCRMLVAKGYSVRSLDRVPFQLEGVSHTVADLRDAKTLKEVIPVLVQDVNTIYHTASLISQDPREDALMYEVNIQATQKLIELAIKNRVPRLIYTSSIDVVFSGNPIHRGDETLSYPVKYLDYYSYSKATAEQAVLNSHNPMGLLTCSLRPAGIYGPGDAVRMPAILKQIRANTWFAIGNGQAEFNHVYVDNVAHAHIMAAEALHPESENGGQAYFITDHAPSFFFDFFEPFIAELGYRIKRRTIPFGIAMFMAYIIRWLSRLPGFQKLAGADLTPYAVASTARDFSFVHDRATEDFGYEPIVSYEEAFKQTVKDLRKRGLGAHTKTE